MLFSSCEKKFKHKDCLQPHVQIHTDTCGEQCSYCKKNVKNKYSMWVHKYRFHEQSGHRPELGTSPRSPINLVGNVSLSVQEVFSELTKYKRCEWIVTIYLCLLRLWRAKLSFLVKAAVQISHTNVLISLELGLVPVFCLLSDLLWSSISFIVKLESQA